MTKARAMLLAAAVTVVSVVAVGGAAAAKGNQSPVVGHVYVDDNTASVNTIGGFDRHNDGTLTPIAGSPFAVGGAGTGHATASQGSLQLSADGKYLLAVDAGSNQISVAKIKGDGSLDPVGSPVSSNGTDPVSIAVSFGDLVYVANAGPSGSNYTGFTFDHGTLTPLAGSTVALSTTDQPGDVLFSGDGTKLVGTRVGTSLIDSFVVGAGGLLTKAPGSPFKAQGLGPFGSEFSPTNPSHLFVSNAHDGTNAGSVSAFSDAADGTLASVGASPFHNNQTAPCWVVISRDGRYLYAVNTAVSTVSTYGINADGSLTLVGSTPLPAGMAGPEDAGLSPNGQVLWVVASGSNALNAFSILGDTLLPIPQATTSGPAGASPSGLVVT